jgi:phosphoribosylamine--glycine ligase
MKVLFLSQSGDGLGVAHRIREQGHEVNFWIQEPKYRLAGKGLVNRPASFRPLMDSTDLVVSDMVGFGTYSDLFRKRGKPTLSLDPVVEQIELDREKAAELFGRLGIEQPPSRSFGSIAEAKKALYEGEWKPVVLKPSGNMATAKTMVCQEKEECEWALSTYPAGTRLTVQDFVQGVEVSTEGWWNGRDFLSPFNMTFEEKRFLEGNLGQNTGCMGNVVVTCGSNRLTKATVEKLIPFLRKTGYRGPVDLNSIVTKEKALVLEATCRMGYDAVEALCEGLREPILDILFETATGVKKEMNVTSDTMISVRLSVPPYPMGEPGEKDKNIPVLGINRQNFKHLWLTDIYVTPEGFFTAGGDGCLLKATAIGRRSENDLVREARNRVYRTLAGIQVPNKQYRRDIGSRVNSDYNQLKEWGWL